MKSNVLKIKLGPVTLSLAIGDADSNGALDLSLGVRFVGLFHFDFPPVNLDAKLAQDCIDAFGTLAKNLAPKK